MKKKEKRTSIKYLEISDKLGHTVECKMRISLLIKDESKH